MVWFDWLTLLSGLGLQLIMGCFNWLLVLLVVLGFIVGLFCLFSWV